MVISTKLKARSFKARFLEPGVVGYTIGGEDEIVLIKPENLNKIAQDFKGVHVIVDHQDVDLDNTEVILGYVGNVWIDPSDGWAWCDFTINDDEAIGLINQGFSISCAYNPEFAEGGTFHNVPYDREIIGGQAVHMAIVEHPRYEEAEIFENSTNKKTIMLFKFKKEKKENSAEVKEVELENSKFEIEEGVTVDGIQLVNAYRNAQEEKKKEEETTKFNADDDVEIDGKKVKMSELIKAFKARQNTGDDKDKKENAGHDEEDEKKENTGDDKDKKENQDETEEEKKKREKEKSRTEAAKNSVDAKKIKATKDRYDNGVPDTEEPQVKVILDSDRFAKGATLYGSPQKVS